MSYKKLTSILVIYTVLMLSCGFVPAQNYDSEEEVKKQAEKFYQEDQFVKAMPLYSQLLSLYPKDPNFNYKYGVCILFADADKGKPIAFLEFASKKPEVVDNEVFYYLGRAYHVNYRFSDAIGAYNVYKKKASTKFLTKLKVDRQIEMCNNGLELLKNVKDLVVMQKKDLAMSEYFRAYDLGLIDSKLIVKPDDFKTSTDKKKSEESVLVSSPKTTDLYISSYGDNDKNGKEIFRIKKTPNGEFSIPQNLGTTINTSYDEDYPYFSEKNKTLYFCSKGHNSIGGYDVFKSVYNEGSQQWSNPVNMDFPISSPDDDLLYIPDTSNEVAYFSSRRGSVDGNIGVYKIKVGRLAVTTALIKGKFYTTDDEGVHPKSKIIVKNASNNKLVGVFNSSEKTGTYIVNVPSGAKYLFTVETDGFIAQSVLVDIPEQQTIRPLKQKINMKKENGIDKLSIYNNFDDFTVDEETFQAGIALIREKANLDVNYTEELENNLVKESDQNNTNSIQEKETNKFSDVSNANNSSAENNTNSKGGTIGKNLTNEDLVKMAKNDAKDAQREADAAQDQSDEAFTYSNIKNEESQNKAKQSEEIKQAANAFNDPIQKQAELDKANQLEKESKQSAQQAIVSYNLAKDLEANADQKQKEARDADKYASELDIAIKSNSKESIIKLNEQQAAIEKGEIKKSSIDNVSVVMQQQSDAKRKEAEKDSNKAVELENQARDMDLEAADLKKQADASKDEQVKGAMLNQLAELNDDKKQRQEQSVKLKWNAVRLNKEADELQQQSQIIVQVVSNLNNTPDNTSKEMDEVDKQKLAKQIAEYESQNGKQETASKDNANSKTNNTSSNQLTDNSVNNPSQSNTNTNKDNAVNPNAQNGKVDNGTSTNASENKSNIVSTDYNVNYQKQLDDVNLAKISELEKEKKMAEVNANWAESLKVDINALNKQAKLSSNKTEKAELKTKVKELESAENEKQELADAGNKSVKALEKEEAKNKDGNGGTEVADYNSNYSKQLEDVDLISDPIAKENKKIELNEQWAKAIYSDLIKQKELLEKTKKKKVKEEITKRIADLESQQEEKLTTVDESKEKIPELKRTAAIAEQSRLEAKSKTISTNSSKYGLPEASAQAIIANEQFKQASDYKKQSDSLKLEAQNSKVQDEKFAMYNKSQVFARQAQVRNVKAYETLSTANQLQYKNNASVIADMAKSNPNSDYASRAVVVNTEADYYNNEAAKLRTIASASNDDVEKEKILERAAEYEKIALDKQASTYAIYKNADTNVLADNSQNPSQTKTNKDADVANVVKDNEQPTMNKELPLVIGTTINSSLSEEEYNFVIKSSDYINYALLKSDADKLKQESTVQRKQADNFKTQAESEQRFSQELLGFAKINVDTGKIVYSIEELRKYKVYNESSKRNSQKSDSTNMLAETATKQAVSKNEEAQKYLNQLDGATANKVKQAEAYKEKSVLADNSNNQNTATDNAVNTLNKQTDNSSVKENKANNATNESNSVASNTNTSNATNAANTNSKSNNALALSVSQVVNENNELTQEVVFEKKTVPAYSKKNPIPINDKLPKGLVFKVQIGAFRNPIPQELFKDFAPVMGETTASGITRYTAGIFKIFDAANAVRKEINGIGYKDAFVVAYCNGKRINIEEAKAMIGDGRDCNGQAITASKQLANNNSSNTNSQNSNTAVTNNSNIGKENSNTVTPPINNINQTVVELKSNTDESKGEAAAVTFEQVKGLVYTVQVGVYGNPVKSSQLFNIQPLYFEKTSNGYYRYSSGIFNSEAIAIIAKKNLVGFGVKDAFVTAYYNGKRITTGEARKLTEQNGNEIFVNYSTINQMPNNTNNSTKIASFDINANTLVPKKEDPVISSPENKKTAVEQLAIENKVEEKKVAENIPSSDIVKTAENKKIVVEQLAIENKVEEKKVAENIPSPDIVKTENVVEIAAVPKSVFINGVVYKVNIGEYNKDVPNNVAAIYFEIINKGLEHYQTSSGTTIYSVGAYVDFASANTTKVEVIEKGLGEAFVVAYKDGKQITIDEAKNLTGGK